MIVIQFKRKRRCTRGSIGSNHENGDKDFYRNKIGRPTTWKKAFRMKRTFVQMELPEGSMSKVVVQFPNRSHWLAHSWNGDEL